MGRARLGIASVLLIAGAAVLIAGLVLAGGLHSWDLRLHNLDYLLSFLLIVGGALVIITSALKIFLSPLLSTIRFRAIGDTAVGGVLATAGGIALAVTIGFFVGLALDGRADLDELSVYVVFPLPLGISFGLTSLLYGVSRFLEPRLDGFGCGLIGIGLAGIAVVLGLIALHLPHHLDLAEKSIFLVVMALAGTISSFVVVRMGIAQTKLGISLPYHRIQRPSKMKNVKAGTPKRIGYVHQSRGDDMGKLMSSVMRSELPAGPRGNRGDVSLLGGHRKIRRLKSKSSRKGG